MPVKAPEDNVGKPSIVIRFKDVQLLRIPLPNDVTVLGNVILIKSLQKENVDSKTLVFTFTIVLVGHVNEVKPQVVNALSSIATLLGIVISLKFKQLTNVLFLMFVAELGQFIDVNPLLLKALLDIELTEIGK
jgi:hypothetical protein